MTKKWTPEQSALFEAGANGLPLLERVAVSADAGAGKTSVLSQRIQVFLAAKPESRVLCVSFTEKSAADLSERLSRFAQCEVYTIHGYCFKVVNEFGSLIGLPPVLNILDGEQTTSLLWQAFEKTYRLSTFKNFEVSSAVLFGLCEKTREAFSEDKIHSQSLKLPEIQLFVRTVLDEFEQAKQTLKSLEFSDLEKHALRLLQKKEVRQILQSRYAHLFVDEFQDTSALQCGLVQGLLGPKSLLFVVGDSKQSIYRFRGADVKVFKEFTSTLPAQKKLSVNFRSHPQVLHAVNQVCDQVIPNYGAMQAGRIEEQNLFSEAYAAPDSRVSRITCDSDAQGVLHALADLQSKGIDWSQAVLLLERVKGNEDFFDSLVKAGVPVTLSSSGSAGMNTDLLAFLELWIWVCEPWQKLRAVNVLLHFKKESAKQFEQHYQNLLQEHQQRVQTQFTCEQLLFVLNDWFLLSKKWGALFEQFQVFVMKHQLEGFTPIRLARRLASLMSTDFSGRTSAAGLTDLLITPPPAQVLGALRIMTVHASKGLEFPIVLLADLQSHKDAKKQNPLTDRGEAWLRERDANSKYLSWLEYDEAHARKVLEEKEERARLLYVAMTRAQEALYFIDQTQEDEKKVTGWAAWIRPKIEKTQSAHLLPNLMSAQASTAKMLGDVDTFQLPLHGEPVVYTAARTGVTALAQKLSKKQQPMVSHPLSQEPKTVSKQAVQGKVYDAAQFGTQVHAFFETENWQGLQGFEKKLNINLGKFWKWKESLQGRKVFGPFDAQVRVEREFAFEWSTAHGIVTGRIDRVLFFKDTKQVWIIDYKVFQSAQKGINAALEEYQSQLELYCAAVKELTPHYEVRAFLLDVLGRNSPDSEQLLHQVLHKTDNLLA